MSEQIQAPKGIKESKEAMIGFIKIAALMASVFKDGIQATDFVQIIAKIESDPILKQQLFDAYNGIDQVPGEISDLSLAEGLSIVPELFEALKELFSAINKKA